MGRARIVSLVSPALVCALACGGRTGLETVEGPAGAGGTGLNGPGGAGGSRAGGSRPSPRCAQQLQAYEAFRAKTLGLPRPCARDEDCGLFYDVTICGRGCGFVGDNAGFVFSGAGQSGELLRYAQDNCDVTCFDPSAPCPVVMPRCERNQCR